MLGVVEGRLRKPSMIDQSPGHPLGFVPQQKEQSPSQSLVLRLSRKEAVKTSLYILKVNFFDIKINKKWKYINIKINKDIGGGRDRHRDLLLDGLLVWGKVVSSVISLLPLLCLTGQVQVILFWKLNNNY